MQTYPSYAYASGALIGDMGTIKNRVEMIESYLEGYNTSSEHTKAYRMEKILKELKAIKQLTLDADFQIDSSQVFLTAFSNDLNQELERELPAGIL